MDFRLSQDQEQFRQRLCQFLRAELTPQVYRENEDLRERSHVRWDWVEGFRQRMARAGLLGVGWSAEYGGGGKDMVYQVLFHEEYDYHEGPEIGNAYTLLAPAIMLLGTEEQKRFFMPRLSRGEVDFFLGYSEPEAGSDLANLQCRAVLEGDEFVVNGQKLFASLAQHSDYGWVAVRTDPNAPKHKGISLLIIDMKSPGVSLGRYTTMAQWDHASVYFDNVRVPRSNLVGELNQGWYHIMAAIDYERAAIGNPGQTLRQLDMLLAYCRETRRNGHPLVDDPRVRHLLADLAADVRAAQLTAYWVASMHARGLHPQHEASLAAILKREAVRRTQVAHLELMGPYGQLRVKSRWAPQDGKVEHGYINDTFFHFAAGGLDISRNVVAQRGLGLPRE